MITLYGKEDCSYCTLAEDNLKKKNLPYTKYMLGEDYSTKDVIDHFPNGDIVFPVVLVDGAYIGGAKELHRYAKSIYKRKK